MWLTPPPSGFKEFSSGETRKEKRKKKKLFFSTQSFGNYECIIEQITTNSSRVGVPPRHLLCLRPLVGIRVLQHRNPRIRGLPCLQPLFQTLSRFTSFRNQIRQLWAGVSPCHSPCCLSIHRDVSSVCPQPWPVRRGSADSLGRLCTHAGTTLKNRHKLGKPTHAACGCTIAFYAIHLGIHIHQFLCTERFMETLLIMLPNRKRARYPSSAGSI